MQGAAAIAGAHDEGARPFLARDIGGGAVALVGEDPLDGAAHPGDDRLRQLQLDLAQAAPEYQRQLERCAQLFDPHLEHPLLAVMAGKEPEGAEAGEGAPLLHQTAYTQPALFSMPLAFLATFLVSKMDSSAEGKREIEAFEDQYVRAQTGLGAAGASNH